MKILRYVNATKYRSPNEHDIFSHETSSRGRISEMQF